MSLNIAICVKGLDKVRTDIPSETKSLAKLSYTKTNPNATTLAVKVTTENGDLYYGTTDVSSIPIGLTKVVTVLMNNVAQSLPEIKLELVKQGVSGSYTLSVSANVYYILIVVGNDGDQVSFTIGGTYYASYTLKDIDNDGKAFMVLVIYSESDTQVDISTPNTTSIDIYMVTSDTAQNMKIFTASVIYSDFPGLQYWSKSIFDIDGYAFEIIGLLIKQSLSIGVPAKIGAYKIYAAVGRYTPSVSVSTG